MRIPASVAEIGPYAFYRCARLESLEFRGKRPETPVWKGIFKRRAQMQPEQLQNEQSRLKTIEEGAFRERACLRDVDLPDGLVEICANAFRGSGLERVTFPSTLRRVGAGAFAALAALSGVLRRQMRCFSQGSARREKFGVGIIRFKYIFYLQKFHSNGEGAPRIRSYGRSSARP